MRYLILIQSNPASRALWEELTDDQRMEFGRAHMDLHDRWLDSGDLVASEGLTGPEMAVHVSVRDGKISTDGPFAEVKEYLAGFYVVDCANIEEAIELAALVPDALTGSVEVRPVFDRSVLDL